MARFLAIWFGQVIAGCGANLATFCLGIWLYRQSESVTQFSLLLFFHTVPVVLLAGAAGRAADRWNQRRTLMISDALSASIALVYIGLLQASIMSPLWIYALACAGGCLSAFQWPAYRSWSTRLVAPRDFGRIGGLMKLGEGIPYLLGPVLGGALMAETSLTAVFGINLVAFLLSVLVLAAVGAAGTAESAPPGVDSAAKGASTLGEFLRPRPGLIALLLMSPFIVFTEGWVVTLFQPFMLHHVDSARMGLVLSLGGIGMVVGGILMGIWGGPRRQIFSVLGGIFAQTLLVAALALAKPGFWTGTLAAFFYFFAIPFLSGSNQAIWQVLTPAHLQGRMFAFRRATESIATPASLLTAGLLVDFVLKPLLRPEGPLAFLNGVVPEGPAAPIAVLLLFVAVLNSALIAAAFLYRPVRRIDLELDPPSLDHPESNRSGFAATEAVAAARRSA
ncbi:MAG TPA: MFS transporter [Polyangiaceae bacterium]|nr:MFS transporter [Polyangiaceae bacterium]